MQLIDAYRHVLWYVINYQYQPSPALQSDAINKHVLDKQLTRPLCFNFMHYVPKK